VRISWGSDKTTLNGIGKRVATVPSAVRSIARNRSASRLACCSLAVSRGVRCCLLDEERTRNKKVPTSDGKTG